MYSPIDGYISAEEAADTLVSIAKAIANDFDRKDNCFFESRRSSLNSVMKLMEQYVMQGRQEKP